MSVVAAASLSDLADEELAIRFQDGDSLALELLIQRYRRFARAKTRTYFLVGADADDVEQEGMIGLYKAARDFRNDRQASFRAFAELCVTRQVISAIKAATRQKHQPLNRYVSISGVRGSDDPSEGAVEELLDDHRAADPADEVVSQEQIETIRRSMAENLSSLEVEVLRLYVEGKSYNEIGTHLGRHVKSIDNALQRIKRKLDQHMTSDDDDSELALAC
ncbi:MAG TPA: RNA polymerase sporulation sigma factor SigH [Acidimicrobiales bacterium]|jgi:RNA polymerase sporulation-specific sigma factor|nr:RNA polymerase sporulation sigma factor SigH [Acidimicrobiales bacterium]